MGLLVDGVWREDEQGVFHGKDGAFERPESVARSWVTPDGAAGPTGEGGFQAKPERYHLYVAINCPWAHRAIIYRKLKRLEDVISMSYVCPVRGDEGWIFDKTDGEHRDPLFDASYLHELYTRSHPGYTGRITVPMLWDKQQNVMVNNESSEIIRMFNTAFNAFTDVKTDFYPQDKRPEIDEINTLVYDTINNGVYRAGYAKSQEAYEAAVYPLFDTLDKFEARLADKAYLLGDEPTEADWRLFPTLIRFDAAYVGQFKCNLRQLRDYPNLIAYTGRLYNTRGIAETVDFQAYKDAYYSKNPERNPYGIVPLGPEPAFGGAPAHG